MDLGEIKLLNNHKVFLDRFVAACERDERVAAAFLVGSYAKGKADTYSDIDLCVITADDSFENFMADGEKFFRQLGELVFLEDFDIPKIFFYIFSDDTEGELNVGRESEINQVFNAPYKVLLDKKNVMEGLSTTASEPTDSQAKQIEKMRREIYWFWHDLSHFMTAMRRGQLWWARGQLDVLRPMCINLARFQHNFLDSDAGEDAYSKVEQALPIEQLSPLQETFCPMEKGAMLQAVRVIVDFYKRLAPALAQKHGITYPVGLEKVMMARLNTLTG